MIRLEKIEELTLHMIQLKKENDKLKSEIKKYKGRCEMRKVLYFIPILLCLISCEGIFDTEKMEDTLPPITNTGENTFGMKVNGELWHPSDSRSMFVYLKAISFNRCYRDSCLRLHAIDNDKVSVGNIESVSILFDTRNDTITPHTITIYWKDPETNSRVSKFAQITDSSAANSFSNLDFNYIGQDTILSGQFDFTFTHPDFENEFVITDGRFDVKL